MPKLGFSDGLGGCAYRALDLLTPQPYSPPPPPLPLSHGQKHLPPRALPAHIPSNNHFHLGILLK